jgi:hypothetical protein
MRSESAHNTRLHHRQKSYDENDGPLFLQPQRHSEDDVHEYLMPHNSEGRVEHQPDVDLHHIETGLHDRVHSVLSSFSTATTTTTTRSTSFYHATATESQSMSTNLSTRVLQTLNSVLSRAEAFQQQHRVRFQAIKRKMQVNVDDEDRAPIDEMTEFEKDIVKAALYYHRKLQALSALFDWLCHRQKSAFVQWKEFVQFQKEKREANKIAVHQR